MSKIRAKAQGDGKVKKILSFSGGKDSTAILLKFHELDLLRGIDILHISMGDFEYPEMLEHITKVEKYINKKITIIEAFPAGSQSKMLNHIVNKRDGTTQQGYWWCGKMRWGTTYKMQKIKSYYKRFDEEITEIIGYAVDEKSPARQKKIQLYREGGICNKIFPLIDWNWSEQDALKYCYSKGFDWGGLYELNDRVSCWCCQNNNLRELKNMFLYRKDEWEKLKNLDKEVEKRAIKKYGEYSKKHRYKANYTFEELEEKFTISVASAKTNRN